MANNKKDNSSKKNEVVNQKMNTSENKLNKGGADESFPQEFEEQQNMELRMKPQPLVKPKKVNE